MIIAKNINKFTFNKAEYFVGDSFGNEILVRIRYSESRYEIKVIKSQGRGLSELCESVSEIAKDLIKRKSKVNFAQAS